MNVFLIKDDSVYFVRVHYRELEQVVHDPKRYLRYLQAKYLDAGYVLVDMNQRRVLDSQGGVQIKAPEGFDLFR